ncbi:MAG: hypothetical protein HY645_00550 [Acidobacteria bacterium]|nr:hypothetical protein [Acidobacteriota bacterium]
MSDKQRLLQLIDAFRKVQVVVVGDFLLDEFVFGEIARVSREAPVLILKYQDTHSVPGGAANTVANVESLEAKALPVGFIGQDEKGRTLLKVWPPSLDRSHVFCDPSFSTTSKSRILAGSFHSFRQQVVRLDYENPLQLTRQHEQKVMDLLSQLMTGADALVLSDYELGNVSPAIVRHSLTLGRECRKPVVVDSRSHLHRFRGATALTPNITEVESTLSRRIGAELSTLERTGHELRRQWELESLLITRGKLGMSLFEEGCVTHIPIYGSDEVADVTGAGDTVVATYTTALAAGASHKEAAYLANLAGGIVVMKRGTATVSSQELRSAVTSLRN